MRLLLSEYPETTALTRYHSDPKNATMLISTWIAMCVRGVMDPIRVLLCNHHPIVRSGLRLLLEREPGIRVIGEAANSREAVALTEYQRPDVVLLDVKLPHMTGMRTAREITAKAAGIGVIFVSEHVDEEYVTEAFKAGARGYVRADSVQTDLIRAIGVVGRGGRFVSAGVRSEMLET